MITNQFGFDKIQFFNLLIKNFNIEHLINLSQSTSTVRISFDCNGKISILKIMDNKKFGDLTIGKKKNHDDFSFYAHLTLMVTYIHNNNWNNLSWSEYTGALQDILKYIETEYLIQLDGSMAKLMYAEVNCNIQLSAPYTEYDRAIRYLLSLCSMHLKKYQVTDRLQNNETSNIHAPTYTRSNEQMAVVFYNKSTQMVSKSKESDTGSMPLLRLEIKLLSAKKIKDVFGTNIWNNLNDDSICDHINPIIEKTFIKKYYKQINARQKELIKLLKKNRKEHPKTWHHITMADIRNRSESSGIPYVLDIQQVIDALYTLPDKHNNRSRWIKALLSIKVEHDLYFSGDLNKAAEIVSTLQSVIN